MASRSDGVGDYSRIYLSTAGGAASLAIWPESAAFSAHAPIGHVLEPGYIVHRRGYTLADFSRPIFIDCAYDPIRLIGYGVAPAIFDWATRLVDSTPVASSQCNGRN